MKPGKIKFSCVVLFAAFAQVSKENLKAIPIPGKLETIFGTFQFFDGVPVGDTYSKNYDNPDRQCAMNVYPGNVGGVTINAFLEGLGSVGDKLAEGHERQPAADRCREKLVHCFKNVRSVGAPEKQNPQAWRNSTGTTSVFLREKEY